MNNQVSKTVRKYQCPLKHSDAQGGRELKKCGARCVQEPAANDTEGRDARLALRCWGVLLWLLMDGAVLAGDWPQILGTNRNGVARNEKLTKRIEAGTHKTEWTYQLGQGFAGPVVVGNQVLVFHRVGNQERIEAIDRTSGKQLWKRDFDAIYRGGVNPDTGPRCVPVVVEDKVILFGAAGEARAVSLANGKQLWSRDLFGDYQGDEGYFGAGSTPIVSGNLVLFNVGGKRKQAGIVALDINNGKTAWLSTSEGASYSSPISFQYDQKERVAFVTRLNLVIIDPKNGKVSHRLPFGMRGPTVNGATPLLIDKQLFLTASYGIGAKLVKLEGTKTKVVWQNDSSLSSQYNTPVYHQGVLFGIHGREDIGTAELRCVSANDGRVRWRKEAFGVAHLISADKQLVAVTIEGTVVLLEVNADKYVERGRLQIGNSTTRAIPALSNGKLYLRDSKNLYCVNLAPKS